MKSTFLNYIYSGYPTLHKDRLLYRYGNKDTRIGTDDNAVVDINDIQGNWYDLLKLMNGENTGRKIFNYYNKHNHLSNFEFISIISKLLKRNVIAILKFPFHIINENTRYSTDLTYYYTSVAGL